MTQISTFRRSVITALGAGYRLLGILARAQGIQFDGHGSPSSVSVGIGWLVPQGVLIANFVSNLGADSFDLVSRLGEVKLSSSFFGDFLEMLGGFLLGPGPFSFLVKQPNNKDARMRLPRKLQDGFVLVSTVSILPVRDQQ